jgi:hypothetical protein
VPGCSKYPPTLVQRVFEWFFFISYLRSQLMASHFVLVHGSGLLLAVTK